MKTKMPLGESEIGKGINDLIKKIESIGEAGLNEESDWLHKRVINPATGNRVYVASLDPEDRKKYAPKGMTDKHHDVIDQVLDAHKIGYESAGFEDPEDIKHAEDLVQNDMLKPDSGNETSKTKAYSLVVAKSAHEYSDDEDEVLEIDDDEEEELEDELDDEDDEGDEEEDEEELDEEKKTSPMYVKTHGKDKVTGGYNVVIGNRDTEKEYKYLVHDHDAQVIGRMLSSGTKISMGILMSKLRDYLVKIKTDSEDRQ